MIDFGLPNATMHKVGECAAVEDIRALSRIYERVVRKVSALSDRLRCRRGGVAGPGEEFLLEHRRGEDEALDRVAAHRAQDIGLRDGLDRLGDDLAARRP